jgi:hypothetical protein
LTIAVLPSPYVRASVPIGIGEGLGVRSAVQVSFSNNLQILDDRISVQQTTIAIPTPVAKSEQTQAKHLLQTTQQDYLKSQPLCQIDKPQPASYLDQLAILTEHH